MLSLFIAAQTVCSPLATLPTDVEKDGGSFVVLADLQNAFARGVWYATPPMSEPFGDKSALIRFPGLPGGMVVFLDGDQVCQKMTLTPEVLADLLKVGEVVHESGAPL